MSIEKINRVTKTIKISPKSATRCDILAEKFGGSSHLIECLLTLSIDEVTAIVAKAEPILADEENQRKATRKVVKSLSKMSDAERVALAKQLKEST